MSTALALAFERIGSPKILVIGDLIVDTEHHCTVRRFAQESQHVPVWEIDRREVRMGGAGAVAAMVSALGASVSSLYGPGTHATKHRYFVDGVMVGRADVPVQDDFRPPSFNAVSQEARNSQCVLLADYGKGVCTPQIILEAAIQDVPPCIVDPHQHPWQRYAGATAIKLNAAQAAGQTDKLNACDSFAAIVETHGSDGIRLAERGYQDATILSCRPRHVVDVTGAGDMVLAALGVCIAGGMSWADACKVANAAAGLKVERRGAVPVPKCEVVADLLDDKIVCGELLSSVAQAAKLRGPVVWANGCMDGPGLHFGHRHYLSEAKRQGKTLIVGVNGDQSVRDLKGAHRPLSPLIERLDAVASLECVDYVVPFSDEDHLGKLIASVRPAVLAKGSDWRGKDVIGSQHAGRLHFVDRLPGYTTSGQ